MELTSLFFKFFFSLFAIVNPIGMLPVFITLTDGLDNDARSQTNRTAMIAVTIILVISLVIGKFILDIFGISISSFRIAGGFLVAIIGTTMINGKLSETKQNKEEVRDSMTKTSVAIVPLALPLIAGPGSITSMIDWGATYNDWVHKIGFVLLIMIFCLACWLLFRSASFITRAFGKTGLNVITRIMGLILMAIGVEMMIKGILGVFPALGIHL